MPLRLIVLAALLGVGLRSVASFSYHIKPPGSTRLNIAAPPRAAPKPLSGDDTPAESTGPLGNWAPPSFKAPRPPSEFELNQGRVIDTLRQDYPRLFVAKPDLSIFNKGVELYDPSGKRLSGLAQYEKIFDMLRFLRRTTMADAEITYRLVTHEGAIRVRWSAKMYLRDPAFGLTQLNIIDGVSVYELDTAGKIRTHRLENIVMTDQMNAQPVSLGFLWPTPQMATPELAMPFFRAMELAKAERDEARRTRALSFLRRASWAVRRRGGAPKATLAGEMGGEETPMQKAARERAEDAEKAQRLADLRTPRKADNKKKGLFGLEGPQQCETSYDCEEGLVCCDLIVASICCAGGIMIPQTQDPVLQRRAIPIPVEKDSPFPPGMGGGGAPRYPGS